MNKRGQTIDKTYLSIDMAEDRGFLHRDYIAHCLRWTHISRELGKNPSNKMILDIGCGRELPLPKLLYSSRFIVKKYTGIDVGIINDDAYESLTRTGKFNATIYENTDFSQLNDFLLESIADGEVTHIVCLEVLEHVEPPIMLNMLKNIYHIMRISRDCTAFISTPCWDRVSCAGNHVNEMTYNALGGLLEDKGFTIKNVWGTFASIKDYKEQLFHDGFEDLFNNLRSYYDVNFLSCIFAPLYPEYSRNCLWELKLNKNTIENPERYFEPLINAEKPWGSSVNWEKMHE